MPWTIKSRSRLWRIAIRWTDGLRIYGPTVQVAVGVHEYYARSLRSKGKPVPAPIVGKAMIDTGATMTTIDIGVAKSLALPQSGVVQACGIGGDSAGFRAACSVDIKGLKVNIPLAHCHNLPPSSNLIALIGRDILCFMMLKYDGVNGVVTLTIPNAAAPAKPPNVSKHSKRRRRH